MSKLITTGEIFPYISLKEEPTAIDLPFVADIRKNKKIKYRSFWHVESTATRTTDCLLGKYYAIEYINFQMSCTVPFLTTIISHMPRELTGIEVGFLSSIEEYIVVGALEHAKRQ